jgi:AcrR family transcriptional regulator
MSGKKPIAKAGPALAVKPKAKQKMDSRARRTRDALGDALVELMHEKTFGSIKVQDVLDRAGVGRSTFYTHYRDKDDLFLSDVEDFWEMISTLIERSGEDSNRVAPVRELFSHIAEVKVFRQALVASDKVHDVMELGQGHFARAIERRLTNLNAAPAIKSDQLAALAHALAGALFALLDWWIDHGMKDSAAEMDKKFHQLVWMGVNASNRELAMKPATFASR